jgi:cell division protein FtsQ
MPASWLSGLGRVFTGVAMIMVLAGIGLSGGVIYRSVDKPVAAVTITTSLRRVSRLEIEEIVGVAIDAGFLSLDLDSLRHALEQHPWIAQATTRRHWPDRIEIEVAEETAIARWGHDGILNLNGELIRVNNVSALIALPSLSGPEGSVRDVMREYRDVNELLLGYGLKAKEFGVDGNRQWHMYLDAGFAVLLGQHNITAKVGRFLGAWGQQLKPQKDQIRSVDARYENGVAVLWQ